MVINNNVLSILIASSMLIFALRGKFGAAVITICVLLIIFLKLTRKKIKISYCYFYAVFLLGFAVIFHAVRSYSFEYYLLIGYLAATLVLMNSDLNIYNKLWNVLGYISIFEAIGIYMQWLLPTVYYSFISLILPSSVIFAIRNRLAGGYYTGFCREVSYTMFFVVIGLGIYIFNLVESKNEIISCKKKRIIIIVFLLGALVISGKRATLLFFVVAIFIIQFINSRDRLKIVKYLLLGMAFIGAVWVLYPLWSRVPALSRIVDLLKYISADDMVGITNGRTAIYENAIELWKKNRMFGIGWGNFKYSTSQSTWYVGFDVHNCYLQILCETGIIGAIFYYILTFFSIINSIRSILITRKYGEEMHNVALLTAVIQIFFCMYSSTEPILYEYTDYIIYFISINITCLILKHTKMIKQKENNKGWV